MKVIRVFLLSAVAVSMCALSGCDNWFTTCYVYVGQPGVCHNTPPHARARR